MIRYGQQDITSNDIEAVVKVLNSLHLTQGPNVQEFEEAVASYVGAKHAVAMNSATSALHTACLALCLGPGDYLWTTPNTFVASANCGLYCGAKVDFVDIDPKTYNICPLKLEEKLIEAEKKGQLPKIVIPVHLAGQSCDMESIYKLSLKYGFKIIEDASHAIGGKYKDEYIGSGKYCDITILSFHPVKIITTAEGGMAITNSEEIAQKLRLFHSHGITRDPKLMNKDSDGPWYYQQVALGYNYRMTDLQAALGVSQIKRLSKYVERRQEIASFYNDALKELPVLLPWQHPDTYSAYHLYIIRLKNNEIKRSHKEVFEFLRDKEIMVNLHYIPVHTQPYYQAMGFKNGDYPEAEKFYEEAISIPMHPNLSPEDLCFVVESMKQALQ